VENISIAHEPSLFDIQNSVAGLPCNSLVDDFTNPEQQWEQPVVDFQRYSPTQKYSPYTQADIPLCSWPSVIKSMANTTSENYDNEWTVQQPCTLGINLDSTHAADVVSLKEASYLGEGWMERKP
jgi:hypothetical protein